MSHNRDDRGTVSQVFFVILFYIDRLYYLRTDIFCLESELFCYDIDRFRIESLIDRHHDTDAHTSCDNVIYRYVHHDGQIVSGNELGQFQNATFFHLLLFQFLSFIGKSFAFLFTPFCTLFLSFGCQSGQCFLNLFLYILFTDFGFYRFFQFQLRTFWVTVVSRLRICGRRVLLNIYFFFADTFPFFAFHIRFLRFARFCVRNKRLFQIIALFIFSFALFPFLFFCFFLRTSLLIQR